ncbi:MAG: hypothetical protein RBT60_10500 [Candidatus Krumholzibacteria bacterium]|nr:hypothetical protein [Candidatus Krumholzibacteria bacterium]
MMTSKRTNTCPLTILSLAAALAIALPVHAGDCETTSPARDRKGWFVGINAGFGASHYSEDVGKRTVSDDPFGGALGGLRVGYAVSNAFAVSLEGHGFGSSAGRDEDWGLGAGFVTATWWPRGGGFFVRAGVGAGGGEILLRRTDELVEVEDKVAAMFGIGYEWQISRRFALGLAADGFGIDLDGVGGGENEAAGASGVSIQLNWYL